jgi:hypothetical protein
MGVGEQPKNCLGRGPAADGDPGSTISPYRFTGHLDKVLGGTAGEGSWVRFHVVLDFELPACSHLPPLLFTLLLIAQMVCEEKWVEERESILIASGAIGPDRRDTAIR